MPDEIVVARETLVQELGRLSDFVGFNKGIGQIYAWLYLNKEPVSLGEIAEQLGISKGNASLNMQVMERWGLVHPVSRRGDRKDYYTAETDFWKIVHGIIASRDKKEIERTLDSLNTIVDSLKTAKNPDSLFYRERMEAMLEFGNAANHMLEAFINMSHLRDSQTARSSPPKKAVKKIQIQD